MKRVVRKATIAPGYKYTNSNNRADELRTRSILSVIWSTIVFILNTYILFTVIYWISVGIMPSGTIIFFEVAMEVFLLIELGLRVLYLKISRRAFESLNLLHTRDQDGVFVFLLLLVSNIPLVMIYSGIHNTSSKVQSIFSRIMVLKLLRCFEILRTFERVEEILFYKKFKTLIIVKSVKNFVSLLLTAHILTCGWLLIGSTHAVDIYQGIETNEHNPYRDSKELWGFSLYRHWIF